MESIPSLQLDFGAEDGKELGEPGRMGGPGGPGDKIAVGDGFGHGEIDVRAAGAGDVRTDGGIGAAFLPLQNICGSQDLRGMTDGGDGFIGLRKMTNDFEDARIEANVFWRAAAGNDQGVVLFGFDVIKGGV